MLLFVSEELLFENRFGLVKGSGPLTSNVILVEYLGWSRGNWGDWFLLLVGYSLSVTPRLGKEPFIKEMAFALWSNSHTCIQMHVCAHTGGNISHNNWHIT